MKHKNR